MKIILIFLILLLPKFLMGETKSLLCELEGTGKYGSEGNRYSRTVKIQQTVKFNEDKLISVKNDHLKEYDFDEAYILREGWKMGVLEVSENIVSDEYIRMTIVKREGEKFKEKDSILEVTLVYQSVQINRMTGISKTKWLTAWGVEGDESNVQDYEASGDCKLLTKKF